MAHAKSSDPLTPLKFGTCTRQGCAGGVSADPREPLFHVIGVDGVHNFAEYKEEVECRSPPPPITSDRVGETQKFFMNPAPSMAESRIHKKALILSIIKGYWGGGAPLHLCLMFCRIV